MQRVVAASQRGRKKLFEGAGWLRPILSRWCLVRFASLVDLRHSYPNARTTGPDFVFRSNGRWAKRTAHGLSLGTTVSNISRSPYAGVRLVLQASRVIESLWVSKGNTSRPCAIAPRRHKPSSAAASWLPHRSVLHGHHG